MSDGTSTWTYTYDANGMRTKRTNGTTTYTYVYNGGQLTQMTVGTDVLTFTYDANGNPFTFTYNSDLYYYVTNVQGDVVMLINSAGIALASYSYDAWGNLITIDASGDSALSIATINPLRYRGYVYDNETELYYLQSRYYNPEIGRFLSADAVFDYDAGLQGFDLFAYCGNDPINRIDISGTDSISIDDLDLTDDQISEREGGSTPGSTGSRSFTHVANSNANSSKNGNGKCNALQTYYPPNNGFTNTPEKTILQPGTRIQRTGNMDGSYVAPAGTPKQALSLPPSTQNASTTFLEVLQPTNVLAGRAAPWFGQIGGGVQYYLLDGSVSSLIAQMVLVVLE